MGDRLGLDLSWQEDTVLGVNTVLGVYGAGFTPSGLQHLATTISMYATADSDWQNTTHLGPA